MTTLEQAKKLKAKGFSFIPLLKGEKHNGDNDILQREYTLEHLQNPLAGKFGLLWDVDGNLGINLKKSGLYDIDFDNPLAIYFAKLWLPQNTLILGRRYPDGKEELTHWFFRADGTVPDNDSRKNLANESTVELFVDRNIVVYGTTMHKELKIPMTRFWHNDATPALFTDSVKRIFNTIAFACAVAPHMTSANTGLLKLDSCLYRYCKDWTDDDRERFLLDFISKVLPTSKEATPAKIRRIIKANNNDSTNNAGYNSFADYIGVDRKIVKSWFAWIGTVPGDDKWEIKKSYKDFMQSSWDVKESLKKVFPPMKYAVSPILPEGLSCIAGRPKAMKSWTELLKLICVQNGIKFLGHETVKGDCLYLALEDSERRIMDRIKKLNMHNLPEYPRIINEAPYLGQGLEESLKDWIDSVPNPRLICIDTLARVKPRVAKSNATAFDLDNQLLRDIQKLAINNSVSISFVTHLNKSQQEYSFDKIQGSVGMQGMADAMWLVDRGDNSDTATIIGRGRDILDFEYAVEWNANNYCYEYKGNAPELRLTANRQEVVSAMIALQDAKFTNIKPRDVFKHCGYKAQSKDATRIQKTMERMRQDGQLRIGEENLYGTYRYVDNKKSSF